MTQRLALGLSGGGDSLALLFALRATYPEAELHALIVDHGLRDGSAGEARQAAAWARAAGAHAHILTSTDGRRGQGHARMARHRLLAAACRELDLPVLCLGHTLDDRVETLRMRQARPGPQQRLAGPSSFDPSPAWPKGRDIVMARPFLSLRRAQLREYLRGLDQDWIDDPSNEDPSYERVRLRQDGFQPHGSEETALLQLSDQVQAEVGQRRVDANALMNIGVSILEWGGVRLDRDALKGAEPETVRVLLETLLLAVSGRTDLPEGIDYLAFHVAVIEQKAYTAAGVHLTADGTLGRDPGAVTGRADGTRGVAPIELTEGQSAVFDGRWHVRAKRPVILSAWGQNSKTAGPVPPVLRPGLMAVHDGQTGEFLALPGVNETDAVQAQCLTRQRIAARLLPPVVPTWFDGDQCARNVVATLAKRDSNPNITS